MAKPITSAGCLIIGDEVLNGKIHDKNSHTFAKFCFHNLAIPLKRTMVCGDDRDDITKLLNFLLNEDKVDLVVTSGGLGSTHDDITYDVLAEYFGVPNQKDPQVVERMQKIRGDYIKGLSEEQKHAYFRMATVPQPTKDVRVEKYFTDDLLWFPIVGINERVYVFPGVPPLFDRLIESIGPLWKLRVESSGHQLQRRYVKTAVKEAEFATYLGQLQQQMDEKYGKGKIKLGSYPHISWDISTVSIIGESIQKSVLDGLVQDIAKNVNGTEISAEEEERYSEEK